MDQKRITFIGGGNMTRAIAAGLLDDGFPAANLTISEPLRRQREALAGELPGVALTADNDAAVANADAVVLAVKPQILPGVCKTLAKAIACRRPVIISVAAGPRIEDIDAWLGGNHAVVRVMPNQPALLRCGVSGLYANERTSDGQRNAARKIMAAVGAVVEVHDEADIDAVTAVSGSGPAYFFLLIDIIAKSGAALGLDPAAAATLARETAFGAAMLTRRSDEPMDDLIERVRSPGGTTAAALDVLDNANVRDIVSSAIAAARDRAVVLADEAHAAGKD